MFMAFIKTPIKIEPKNIHNKDFCKFIYTIKENKNIFKKIYIIENKSYYQ
jgi:hypothetical protein